MGGKTSSTTSSPPWPGSPCPRSTQQQAVQEGLRRKAELSPWTKLRTKFSLQFGNLRNRNGDEFGFDDRGGEDVGTTILQEISSSRQYDKKLKTIQNNPRKQKDDGSTLL